MPSGIDITEYCADCVIDVNKMAMVASRGSASGREHPELAACPGLETVETCG